MIISNIKLEKDMDKFISLYLKLKDVMDALEMYHALKDFENDVEYDKFLDGHVTSNDIRAGERRLVSVANQLIIEYVTKAIPEED